jgi:hypothetical protein
VRLAGGRKRGAPVKHPVSLEIETLERVKFIEVGELHFGPEPLSHHNR